ncbi:hypothetical protein EZV62_009422 [Acer yangbiense]|uniref:Replication factor C C-terminal domain-containing protein n=1 Tax=Acer yangbiense TaxID=1000413 RepID=A0A5C7I0H3_9ROSI|nr:hypothetical protein EZV62_009422 [Acer yangbiense]
MQMQMQMPMSPSPIPRSSSYPNLSSSSSSSAIRASNRPVCSSARSSAKFSYINLLSNLFFAGRKSSESDLTEESLEAHNRRLSTPIVVTHRVRINAICNEDKKNSKCSPYYKGLTDATLAINRSGRESQHATSSVATSTSSTLSSFIIKMQEWSSCITFQFRGDHINHTASATNSSSIDNVNNGKKNTAAAQMTLDNKRKAVIALLNDRNKEKPLRESTISSVTSESSSSIVKVDDQNIEKEKEREFIWANKYQPTALKDFICNRDKAIQLQGLVTKEEGCGNFIFEGPPGVGKRTMIMAMLRQAFGPEEVLQTRQVRKVFELKGEMIAIILCEADKLSTDALLYIRWIIERYKGFNKVFFCCSDVSKLQPIKSLCTLVQLLPPSKQEIVQVVEFIAKQQGIELPHKLAEKIADNSKNNLRQAIRSFEASWQMSYPFEEEQGILTGWEDDITNIAKKIIEEQSPKQLYIIRGKLQNLIEHDVSLDFIFKSLVGELKKDLDVGLHRQIDCLYDEYNRGDGSMFENDGLCYPRSRHEEGGKRLNDHMRKNVQHFLRIEEFIAKFMSWYKTLTNNNNRYEQEQEQDDTAHAGT